MGSSAQARLGGGRNIPLPLEQVAEKGPVVSGTQQCANASSQHKGSYTNTKSQRTSRVSPLHPRTLEGKEAAALHW